MRMLAWQLARGDRRRLLLVCICVAIGVAARAAVGTVTAQAEIALAREARPLLGGDIEIRSNNALTTQQLEGLSGHLPAGSATTTSLELVTLASTRGRGSDLAGEKNGELPGETRNVRSRMVEVQAIGADYPLLPPVAFRDALPGITDLAAAVAIHGDQAGMAIEASGLELFHLQLGDSLTLGQRQFTVRAVLGEDPALGGGMFALGPQVVIAFSAADSTGLTGFGSRVRHTRLMRLPDPLAADQVAGSIAKTWQLDATERGFGASGVGSTGLEVRTAAQAQFGLRRTFDRLGDFLRLAALGSLLIAAVGVSALVTATVRIRAEELAILITLGATPQRAGRLLLTQLVGVTVLGGALGGLAGAGMAWVVLAGLGQALPLPIQPGFAPRALTDGWLIGTAIAIAAASLPLAGMRSLQPLAILRGESPRLHAGWRRWPLLAGTLALVTFISAWEAHSWVVGSLFIAGLVIGGAIVAGMVSCLMWLLARWRRGPPAVRLGLANLGRPQLGLAAATTALAIAAALLAMPLIHRATLMGTLSGVQDRDIPNLFVIDLQFDQTERFQDFVKEHTGHTPIGLSPIVTARYRGNSRLDARVHSAVDLGEKSALPETSETREQQQDHFFRNREQRLSWRANPGPDERLRAGRWARPRSDERGEATLDADFAARLHAEIGDVLTFDVQGVPVELEVVGLRDVDFLGFQPNFFILVDTAILTEAPQTWIAAVRSSQPSTFIQDLARELPTVTVLDIGAIARQVKTLVSRIAQALLAVSVFALAAGLVVLGALVAAAARERRADAALLRVLGANDRRLRLTALTEFAAQGILAGVLGPLLGIALTALALVRSSLPMVIPWTALLMLSLATMVLTVVVGLALVRRTWREPPLAILRGEG